MDRLWANLFEVMVALLRLQYSYDMRVLGLSRAS